jgi:hypothetical protein
MRSDFCNMQYMSLAVFNHVPFGACATHFRGYLVHLVVLTHLARTTFAGRGRSTFVLRALVPCPFYH